MRTSFNSCYSVLKQNYIIFFQTGLIISLTTTVLLFKISLPTPFNSPPTDFKAQEQELTRFHGIFWTVKPNPPQKVFIPVTIPNDIIIEEPMRDIYMELELSSSMYLPVSEQEPIAEAHSSYLVAKHEKAPQIIGGLTYLQNSINYPSKAIKDNIEGRVILLFIVDKQGKVQNPQILKGVRQDIDQEALRAISECRFQPARHKGKPIPSESIIYIRFEISR